MLNKVITKVFGNKHERDVKRLQPKVVAINALEPGMRRFPTRPCVPRPRSSARSWPPAKASTTCCAEAFAVVREAARRVLSMRHYDVQLIGGIVLHQGKIAEMKTGEGKTLVATLPIYLNALAGKGVHVVTVNDYLARRDAEWMGRIYQFLGLTVGIILHDLADQRPPRRLRLRHHLRHQQRVRLRLPARQHEVPTSRRLVQREHYFAIVDEVDSILIDEARTPLIISGPAEESHRQVLRGRQDHPRLKPGAVIPGKEPDRRSAPPATSSSTRSTTTVALTDAGRQPQFGEAARRRAISTTPGTSSCSTTSSRRLRAHVALPPRRDYLVNDDGEVVIVDEFTGRLMPGRRWSDGLHQAVEAKEGVKIERENQTLATITFQNFFRMYDKLSGMTGTADTEADEFDKIYKLDVVRDPDQPADDPHRRTTTSSSARDARSSTRSSTRSRRARRGQPVLVGTVSVEKSELLVDDAQAQGRPARGSQRQEPRARSRDRRAGRPAGQGHDRHQHGGPRHRHPARRQPRVHGAQQCLAEEVAEKVPRGEEKYVDDESSSTSVISTPSTGCRRRRGAYLPQLRRGDTCRARRGRRARRPAHRRHRTPRVAAYRQPAARPRRPPGRPGLVALLPVARGRPDAHLRVGEHLGTDAPARHGRGRADREPDGHPGDRSGPRSRSKRRTSASASTCSSTTT